MRDDTLHCFTDGTDTYSAYDETDALMQWGEDVGGPHEPSLDNPFVLIEDDTPWTVESEDGSPPTTKPAGEWAAVGRGFVCSNDA